MLWFCLFLSLFAAINLSRGQISPKAESKNGPFLMAKEFLETGTMLLDKLRNQTGNKQAENESDDGLDSQKAIGNELEAKSDNFQQKAFGFLCGIEMKAKNDEKANDTTKKNDNLLAFKELEENRLNFCQNWKNGKSIWKGWKEAGSSIVTSVSNLKLNQQIYGESLRTLAKMEILNSKNKKEFGNFAKFGIDLLKKVTEILKDARMSPQALFDQSDHDDQRKGNNTSRRRKRDFHGIFRREFSLEKCLVYLLLTCMSAGLGTDMVVRLAQQKVRVVSFGNSAPSPTEGHHITPLEAFQIFVVFFCFLTTLSSLPMTIIECFKIRRH
ncbi:hypothetical protein niasHT_003693 [Heterodera trifolii]|uniref:Uncharacterized protein n=1 Tax=Heterodera trifolii TaxID=157864 RepID=A0ABD2M964_9BILA